LVEEKMNNSRVRVCPVEKAGSLDTKIRRWLQNPQRILQPYIKEGMSVLDFGCGPGFFTIEMAKLVGENGIVIASDLQEGMLSKIKGKIESTEFVKRIILHKCEESKISISEKVDFILAFYVIHEIKDQYKLFFEIAEILKNEGQLLIVEPPFHVSRKAFEKSISIAGKAGLKLIEKPKLLFNKSVLLQKV
jgi:ubiquinone/menaquinone biosynthesis C-methylase UbiE